MPYVKGLPSFRVTKAITILLAVLAFGSACYSAWWLRPLARDGSRYAIQMLNLSGPYFDDIRYSHGLFQLPAVFLSRHFSDFQPLSLARIYFLSLVLPVFTFLIYRLWRAENNLSLIVPATILLIGYVPGNSFLINSIFETTFFFYLMTYFLLNERRTGFYIFGILSALGHSSILAGFLILIGFQLVEKFLHKKPLRWSDIFFLMVLCVISILLTIKTIVMAPLNAGGFLWVLPQYLKDIGSPETFTSSICISFLGILLSCLLTGIWRKVLQAFLAILISVLLIMTSGFEFVHANAFNYRVFTLMTMITVILLMWFDMNIRKIEFSSLPVVILIAIGTFHVYHDFMIGREFKRVFYAVQKLESLPGCHLLNVPHEVRFYTSEMAFPIYKIITDNRFDLKYLLFTKMAEQTNPCREFQVSADRQAQFHLGHGYFIWMSQTGRFALPEFAREMP